MKKGLILCLTLLAALTACGNQTADTTVATDSMTITVDSIAVSLTLKVEYPTVDAALQQVLAQYIGETMFFEDGEGRVNRPSFTGDFPAYLQTCARQKWEALRHATFAQQDGDEGDGLTPEELVVSVLQDGSRLTAYEMTYEKVYEDGHYVTWTNHYDFYVNGYGSPGIGGAGVTISKADGKLIGSDLLKDTDSPAFRQLLKEELRQWIKTELGMDADTDEQIKEVLFGQDPDPNALPLPEQRPYLTAEGVVLPYRGYELVAGNEPVCITLPYDKVQSFLY